LTELEGALIEGKRLEKYKSGGPVNAVKYPIRVWSLRMLMSEAPLGIGFHLLSFFIL
jgi:hypothetical protein